jgi:hypothetical protein
MRRAPAPIAARGVMVRDADGDGGCPNGTSTIDSPAHTDPPSHFETTVLAELRAIRELLNRSAGPRDDHQRRLLEALAARLGDGGSFEAIDVIEHGRQNVAFQQLLDAADIQDAQAMGYVLRGARGHVFGGLRLERDERSWRWEMHVPSADGPRIES